MKNDPVVNFIIKQRVFHITHRRRSLTCDTNPCTTSLISLKSQMFSDILTTWCVPQKNAPPRSAWRPEASEPRKSRRGFGCRKRQRSLAAAAALGGDMDRATTRRPVCIVFALPVSSHISQTQTTRGKPLQFCDISQYQKFRPHEPQKNGPGGPKKLQFRSLRLIFSTTVPQIVTKKHCEKMHFCEVHFLCTRSNVL